MRGGFTMPPQLVDDLPVVNDAALRTFEEIGACQYQSSRMGRTRGQDDPSCECTLRRGAAYACTEESGCINRLTQVECVAGVCECGKYCQNQRFQKCAYAPVDIVQTPKKGFGLRAAAALPMYVCPLSIVVCCSNAATHSCTSTSAKW